MSSFSSSTAGAGVDEIVCFVNDLLIAAAVVRLVNAAAGDGIDLSAKSIRHTLEAEFSCSFKTKKILIMKVIAETLEAWPPAPPASVEPIEILQDDDSEFVYGYGTTAAGSVPSATGSGKPNLDHVDQKQMQLLPLASEKRSFVCDDCVYRCATSQILSRHKRFHSAERKFSCDGCNFRFSRRDTLIAHMRTHSRISKEVLRSAVVRLVRAAVSERKFISVWRLRKKLEKEFAPRDFSAFHDTILRTIMTTLEKNDKQV